MVVYLDRVFVLNLAVNYLLLYGAGRLGAVGLRKGRLLLGGLLGALYAVGVYLPHCHWLTLPLWKLLCGVGMVLLAFGRRLSSLRLCAIFLTLTLVLCGGVYGTQLLQNGRVLYHRTQLFYPVSFFTLLLTALAVSAACTLLLPRLTHSPDSVIPLDLEAGGKTIRLSALRDSGNTLRDPISGEAVLIVHWQALRPLLPPGLTASEFRQPSSLLLQLRDLSPRLVPYRAVGTASGLLLAIPCKITVNHHTFPSLAALSPTPVSDGGAYEALTGGNLYV